MTTSGHTSDTTLLGSLASAHRGLLRSFAGKDGITLASAFGALLTVPRHQSNSLRLEALVHLAVFGATGSGRVAFSDLKSAFDAMSEGPCGYLEDPPEGLFVELVRTARGDYRLLTGTWESSGYYLQRILDVVEGLPTGPGYDDIREHCHALLTLSDRLCDRAGLQRYTEGVARKGAGLPGDLALNLSSMTAAVTFHPADLAEAGLDAALLAPFVFDSALRDTLLDDEFGATALERTPLIRRGDAYHLVLPTAVSGALRRYVIETLTSAGLGDELGRAFANAYAENYSSNALLGGRRMDGLRFQRLPGGRVASLVREVDQGRYFQTIFLVDDLEGFAETALALPNPAGEGLGAAIKNLVERGIDEVSARPGFRQGVILVVPGGVGRPFVMGLSRPSDPRWQIESASAPDVETLGWLKGFSPLSLFRLLDAEALISAQGVELQNINGLLNLVGWVRNLGGHLVPHDRLDDGVLDDGGKLMMMIEMAALREVRRDVAQAWDPHVEQDNRGRFVPVRREGSSFFAEDASKPHYATEEYPPRGVYVTSRRSWWCLLSTPPETPSQYSFERWRTIDLWLARAAPVLDAIFAGLPDGAIEWQATFEGTLQDRADEGDGPVSFEEACLQVTDRADVIARIVSTTATAEWELGHAQVDNVAERALVDGLVRATARLAGAELTGPERAEIVDRITGSDAARQQHAFRAAEYRDYVQEAMKNPIVIIEREDDAASRLGLGWKVRDRAEGPRVTGKPDCTVFLNRLVARLEDDLTGMLRGFNRRQTLETVLQNHEAAAREVSHWRRTSAAILALHDDRDAAAVEILQWESKLNAVTLASRIILEFALCECPVEGGDKPGDLDLARLMSIASLIFHEGGDSDAIRWDLMDPNLRITPLGDVHANYEFADTIVEPYGKATAGVRLQDAVESYAANVERPEPVERPESTLEIEFGAALFEAFGADRETLSLFLDHVDNLGLAETLPVLTSRRSRLLDVPSVSTAQRVQLDTLVERLIFHPRKSWRDTPEGYEDRDRHPWRFRRRLAVLRKPLLEIETSDDPELMVAPGMLREAILYMINNYRRGDFHDSQLGPLMRGWKARVADRRGRQCARDVAEALDALGWTTETEVSIGKLLGIALDRDYGDVDVLATHVESGRVLVIECKDVQFRKTFGEVAEQLSDFRGERRPNGRPDYLLKHFDRIDIASSHLERVRAYTGVLAATAVQSLLVFRNPVPMTFALGRLRSRVEVLTLADLSTFKP